jgi:hypothetical protein
MKRAPDGARFPYLERVMGSTSDVIGAVAEIFSWVGFGVGALLAGVALILYIADGTWLPAHGMIDDGPDGRVIRWIDDTETVNEAPLSDHEFEGRGEADIFYRRGSRGRMRVAPGSPVVRTVIRFAMGLLGLGVVALVVSWIVLFAEG